MKLDRDGKEAIRALVQVVGRAGKDTTSADLDEMDIRLTCPTCQPPQAYSWRAYVCNFLFTLALEN